MAMQQRRSWVHTHLECDAKRDLFWVGAKLGDLRQRGNKHGHVGTLWHLRKQEVWLLGHGSLQLAHPQPKLFP